MLPSPFPCLTAFFGYRHRNRPTGAAIPERPVSVTGTGVAFPSFPHAPIAKTDPRNHCLAACPWRRERLPAAEGWAFHRHALRQRPPFSHVFIVFAQSRGKILMTTRFGKITAPESFLRGCLLETAMSSQAECGDTWNPLAARRLMAHGAIGVSRTMSEEGAYCLIV